MELYKLLVPEAFKDGKVDVPRLAQELKTKEPVVEIHVYGQSGKESEAKAEAQVLTDIGKFRWMVLKDGVEVNSFETRTAAQNASKEVEGSKWADRTKAA